MIGAVYVITDPGAPLAVAEQARAAARGGAWAVQLRDKTATDAAMVLLARTLMRELAPLGVKLIINDRVEVAVAAGADGLHIGQGDANPAVARARIGHGKLLGLSVETEAQCAAIPAGIDYIGAGPVRTTATKPDHAAPVGFEGLGRIAARSPVPVVAIGGLGPGDAVAVRRAGGAGLAVVSAVVHAPDPEGATRRLIEEWSAA